MIDKKLNAIISDANFTLFRSSAVKNHKSLHTDAQNVVAIVTDIVTSANKRAIVKMFAPINGGDTTQR